MSTGTQKITVTIGAGHIGASLIGHCHRRPAAQALRAMYPDSTLVTAGRYGAWAVVDFPGYHLLAGFPQDAAEVIRARCDGSCPWKFTAQATKITAENAAVHATPVLF